MNVAFTSVISSSRRPAWGWALAWACVAWLAVGRPAISPAAAPAGGGQRCTVIELYVRAERPAEQQVLADLEAFARERGGLVLLTHDVTTSDTARQRFEQICSAYRRDDWQTPLTYACGRAAAAATAAELRTALEDCLQVELFTRKGCSRCARAKQWLPGVLAGYPGWRLVQRELTESAAARERLDSLVTAHRTAAASVPVFHVCGRLVIGFDAPETTGRVIEEMLTTWSRPCPATDDGSARRRSSPFQPVAYQAAEATQLPLPLAPPPGLPLPGPSPDGATGDAAAGSGGDGTDSAAVGSVAPGDEATGIDLPWLGRVEWQQLGMPLFTILVGLVDGFNPCAMWVLVFLLSILVNLHSRVRMVAIAGTFVFVSGAAYFAFMAAWLNVFLLIGYLRPVQLLLGGLALLVGSIHVKDFFAFKRGLSLSIPESAKPGIYDRVRRIVSAENLPAALAGAFTLAVLVNIVELLGTAGLPALYTNILMQQGLSAAGRYGYLLLYILAYMFDDAIMVAVVVATLSRRRLQETQGRWLKLISGLVILLLGLVMIFKPEWLG